MPELHPTTSARIDHEDIVAHEEVRDPVADMLARTVGTSVVMVPAKDNSPLPVETPAFRLDEQSNALLGAVPGFEQTLRTGGVQQDKSTESLVRVLAYGSHEVVPIDPTKQSTQLKTAASLFQVPPEKTGMIMRLVGAGQTSLGPRTIINVLPALEIDGKTHRVMTTKLEDRDPAWLLRAINQLGPTTHVRVDETTHTAYAAQEMLPDPVHPRTITRAQLDDWMDRLETSGAHLFLDVDEDDVSLDNFIMQDDRLVWCDGDIMSVRPWDPSRGDKRDQALAKWRTVLEHFIEP